jgi:nucleoside-diphosphate-sugar epimerase
MARCLVLGANGFIGSHLIDKLVQNGETVRAFDRFGDRPINFLDDENIEKVSGDFLNRGDLSAALEDVDYVFHLVSTTTPATAENDLSTLTFRISNPYGQRHSPVKRQGVIPIFLHHIANNEPITVLGDGSMVRDYLYVEDVASLIAGSFKEAQEPLYNLGSGQGVSLNQLIETIKNVTQREIRTEYLPKPPTFVQEVVLDINRFKNEFGLAPETSLQDGISKTWQYVLDSGHRD